MKLALGACQVVVVSIVAFSLALISLALRFWSRRIQNVPLRLNDYISVIAMIMTAGCTSVCVGGSIDSGVGYHLQDALAEDPGVLGRILRWFAAGQLLWAFANSAVKFSILSLYTSIFPKRGFRIICFTTMGFSAANCIAAVFEVLLLCRPVQYNWDKSIPGGECHGESISYLVTGIINFLIDCLIIILPMPILFSLRMPLSQKLSIIGMFSLGVLICIISCIRTVWIYHWDMTDITYSITPGIIYTALEPTLGMANSCLPTTKPAIVKIMRSCTFNWTNRHPVATSAGHVRILSSARARDKTTPSTINNSSHHNDVFCGQINDLP